MPPYLKNVVVYREIRLEGVRGSIRCLGILVANSA